MMHPESERERILVVDDAPETLELVERILQAEGYRIFTAISVQEALGILEEVPIDLVVTDMKMPKVSGLDLVRHIRENMKDTQVIMITGYASIEGAVEAVKIGAEEYLAKPFTQEELVEAVGRAIDTLRVRRSVRGDEVREGSWGLIGESVVMRSIHKAIAAQAGRPHPVLICGEAGTGKEAAARAIHYGSSSPGPFCLVSCSRVPRERMGEELFGRQSAAGWPGYLQAPGGGAVLLDDIDRLDQSLQERLLNLLQARKSAGHATLEPKGAAASGTRVRILAASTRPAEDLKEGKGILNSLYPFLAEAVLEMPPLRERGEDILLLARHFTAQAARGLGRPEPRFSDRALQVLREYPWPGNVTEMETVLRRLVAETEAGLIEVPDLPSLMRFSALRGAGSHRTLEEVQLEHIRHVLSRVGGNKTKASEILGIDRKTLREKLRHADG